MLHPLPPNSKGVHETNRRKSKKEFPGAAVWVNVDAHNFCLKVSKKMPSETQYEFLRKHLPLPIEALEISAKQLPENFNFEVDLKPTPPRLSRKEMHDSSKENPPIEQNNDKPSENPAENPEY